MKIYLDIDGVFNSPLDVHYSATPWVLRKERVDKFLRLFEKLCEELPCRPCVDILITSNWGASQTARNVFMSALGGYLYDHYEFVNKVRFLETRPGGDRSKLIAETQGDSQEAYWIIDDIPAPWFTPEQRERLIWVAPVGTFVYPPDFPT